MADVLVAGSFVAAALETAGFLTQESFLILFQDFFRGVGALIYIFTCIGAVISVALFGSYQMARYLLLGPFLFYCAIGYTHEVDGAIWKMGSSGRTRVLNGDNNEDLASAEVQAIVRNDDVATLRGVREGTPPAPQPIVVSGVFYLYTSTISSIVHSFTDLVLQLNERVNNDSVILAKNVRAQMLDSVLKLDPDSKELVHMIQEDLMGKACSMRITASIASMNQRLTDEKIDALAIKVANCGAYIPNSNDPAQELCQHYHDTYNKVVAERDQLLADIESANDKLVTPSSTTLEFIARHLPGGLGISEGTGRAINNWLSVPGNNRNSWTASDFPQFRDRFQVRCKDMYQIVLDAVMEDANGRDNEYFNAALPSDAMTAAERQLMENEICLSIAEKLGADLSAFALDNNCDLSRYYAIFLLRNAISKSAGSKQVQRTKNRMAALAPRDFRSKQYLHPMNNSSDIFTIKGFKKNAESGELNVHMMNETKNKEEWHPMSQMVTIYNNVGPFDVMREQQAYQTRELRQTLFSYALKLPYYQGVILFLLGATYPFLAFVLLMPGRAVSFLSLPLAWLWVKSWDIGFAAVMILEQILWNLFPHRDIAAEYHTPGALYDVELNDLLTDSMRVDFTYDLHAYYLMTSMALLSIPALTGYATLKGRRGILSSFTDGLRSTAVGQGKLTGGAFGAQLINQMLRPRKHLTDTAYRGAVGNFAKDVQQLRSNPVATMSGESSSGSNSGGSGSGSNSGTSSGVNKAAKLAGMAGAMSALTSSNGSAIETAAGAASSAVDSLLKFGHAQTMVAATEARINHPVYGRFGNMATRMEARAAAVDGNLGFEINDSDQYKEALTARQILLSAKLDLIKTLGAGLSSAGVVNVKSLNNKFGAALGMGAGILPSMAFDDDWSGNAIDGVKSLESLKYALEDPAKMAEMLGKGIPEITEDERRNIAKSIANGDTRASSEATLSSSKIAPSAMFNKLFRDILDIDDDDYREAVIKAKMTGGGQPKIYMPEGYKSLEAGLYFNSNNNKGKSIHR